jgi:hypothetical protein
MMEGIPDYHVIALELAGWKIVAREEPFSLWPFDSKACGCKCPDWCDNLSKPKKPELSVVEGSDNPA